MANIIRMSVHEFEDKTGMDVEDVSLRARDDVTSIFMSDDDELPFVGCLYWDGKCSVVGCGMDCFCSYNEMLVRVSGDVHITRRV